MRPDARRDARESRHEAPQLLFIMADQLAASALAAHGRPLVKTPSLDSLTARGTIFENANRSRTHLVRDRLRYVHIVRH